MPIELKGAKFYRTAEACRMAGISKNTFLRWVKTGSFADVEHRDRRGWRLFTQGELERLTAEANRIDENPPAQNGAIPSDSLKQVRSS